MATIGTKAVVCNAAAAFLVLVGSSAAWEGIEQGWKHAYDIDARATEIHHVAIEASAPIANALEAVDVALLTALGSVNTRHPTEPLAHMAAAGTLRAGMGGLDQIRAVSAFDADGSLAIASDRASEIRGENIKGRDFFTFHQSRRPHSSSARRSHRDERFVTAGYLASLVAEGVPPSLNILLTRRIDGADGAFAGVIVAAVDPDYLLHVLLDSALFPGRSLRLLQDDGRLVAAREPIAGTAVGTGQAGHKLLDLAAIRLPRRGVLPNPFTDTPEIAALHPVGNWPFLISVASLDSPDLVRWWQQPSLLLATSLFSLAAAAWLLARALAYEATSEKMT